MTPAVERYREAAVRLYEGCSRGGSIHIDQRATIPTPAHPASDGRWVAAWVWVPTLEASK